jgi:hypothetical protein
MKHRISEFHHQGTKQLQNHPEVLTPIRRSPGCASAKGRWLRQGHENGRDGGHSGRRSVRPESARIAKALNRCRHRRVAHRDAGGGSRPQHQERTNQWGRVREPCSLIGNGALGSGWSKLSQSIWTTFPKAGQSFLEA